MGLRFTVLASGSGGNASLVESDGSGVLIDIGLGPRQLAGRLAKAGLDWSRVQAVLLTHTHSDHWKDATLATLCQRGIPLFCHADHHITLRTSSDAFLQIVEAGLVRPFRAGEDFELLGRLRCRPLPVRHDGGATFGFRLDGVADLFGNALSLAYVADLGCWDDALAESLADVDLLAIEFNHDVDMQYDSGRGHHLIERVLGDEGHLSNEQAADLVRAVLARTASRRLRHLVQLHLSRECNRPSLARKAAEALRDSLEELFEIHTAEQDVPGRTVQLGFATNPTRRFRRARRAAPAPEPWLPGFGGEAAGA
jgi:phosphoribosyl 1,2-cyclic phosphodiesterase